VTQDLEAPAAAPIDPKQDPIIRARIRRMLLVLTILCTAIAVAGFAFVRWLFTLPPGTLKTH